MAKELTEIDCLTDKIVSDKQAIDRAKLHFHRLISNYPVLSKLRNFIESLDETEIAQLEMFADSEELGFYDFLMPITHKDV